MSKLDDLDNFFLEGDLDNDPFASPKDSNKRKSPGDVNVDEEVSVAKKARVPRIKLDQERLLSQKGIPGLRKRAKDLRLKGKGHEWGDASRLLSFYQDWLDDLFPKAKFLDALAMVEKAGHNKQLQHHRVDWINEGRPKTSVVDEGGDAADENDAAATTTGNSASTRIAPIFDKPAASGRPKTPDFDNLFGEEDDIYNATPVGARKNGPAAATGDEPDEDELDALMAMDAASGPTTSTTQPSAGAGAMKSLFGDGKPKAAAAPRVEPDDFDDWDAMLADAEEETPRPKEAPAAAVAVTVRQPARNRQGNEDDDLDALMAEAEAQFEPAKPVEAAAAAPTARTAAPGFDDEEEAMAEMDGLW